MKINFGGNHTYKLLFLDNPYLSSCEALADPDEASLSLTPGQFHAHYQRVSNDF
jgi:hypothetical protein